MLQVFSFLTGIVEIIIFKITVYLVIKQNIFEFCSESRVHENKHSTGKIPVCFPVYGDKVRHPSIAKLLTHVWKKATCATYHSSMA